MSKLKAVSQSMRFFSPRKHLAVAVLAAGTGLAIDNAWAVSVDTGNPALNLQVTSDLRYNSGIRVQGREAAIGNSTLFDEGDYAKNKGDFVINRLDFAPGVDLKFNTESGSLASFGGRVSGQAFHDFATDKNESCRPGSAPAINPATGQYIIPGGGPRVSYCDPRVLVYSDGKLNSKAKRRNYQDAELLDAFGFANFNFGAVAASLRAGQYTQFWGESLFTPFLGISYGMGPVDLNKAISVPGSGAQDVFLPLRRVSGTVSGLIPDVSLAFDLPFSWREPRAPEGGTYFSPADPFLAAPEKYFLFNTIVADPVTGAPLDAQGNPTANPADFVAFPAALPRNADRKGQNHGAYGVMARWSPEFMSGGNLSFYSRRLDEILPWQATAPNAASPLGAGYLLSYARGTQLYGLSAARQIGGISYAAEATYSPNRALNSSGNDANAQGSRGQTWSGLVNGIFLGKEVAPFGFKLWDQWTVTGEVNGSYLQSVTSNSQYYNGIGSAACQSGSVAKGNPLAYRAGSKDGCADRYSVGATAQVTTTWFQVFPGIDLGTALVYDRGIKGTSPINIGGFEGGASGSFAFTADFYRQVTAALAYNYYKTPITKGVNADGETVVTTFSGLGVLDDRDWVSLTIKYSF